MEQKYTEETLRQMYPLDDIYCTPKNHFIANFSKNIIYQREDNKYNNIKHFYIYCMAGDTRLLRCLKDIRKKYPQWEKNFN